MPFDHRQYRIDHLTHVVGKEQAHADEEAVGLHRHHDLFGEGVAHEARELPTHLHGQLTVGLTSRGAASDRQGDRPLWAATCHVHLLSPVGGLVLVVTSTERPNAGWTAARRSRVRRQAAGRAWPGTCQHPGRGIESRKPWSTAIPRRRHGSGKWRTIAECHWG